MKLVLASQGFTTPEIATAVAELVGKQLDTLNIAIINEAYVGIRAGRHEGWLINELSLLAGYTKGTIAFVNLRTYTIEEIRQRLEFADVIYIVGGAQLVLPKLFRDIGFDKLITELAQQKVVMGTSAGANVLGRLIEDPAYWQDQYGESEPYLAQPPLALVDFNIIPHLTREDKPRRTAEILAPLLRDHPFPLYAVTDEQAVVYDNGAVRFVGGNPVIFGNK